MWCMFVLLVVLTMAGDGPAPVVAAAAGGAGGAPRTIDAYVIRHAQSTWNEAREAGFWATSKWIFANKGGCDAELTQKGTDQTKNWEKLREEAGSLGAEIKAAIAGNTMTFLSSPLIRTYETISGLHRYFGGTPGQDTLNICPSLRELSPGGDAKSRVMWQCRGLKKMTSDGGTMQERVIKFLKEGRKLPSLAENYGAVWKDFNAIAEVAADGTDYKKGTYEKYISAEYYKPFLQTLFATTPATNKALVSTHSHWIMGFAHHALEGVFGPAPAGNWATYKGSKVDNSHIIKLTITQTPKPDGTFEYSFADNVLEQPPIGTPVGLEVASGAPEQAVDEWTILGGCMLVGLAAFGLGRYCSEKRGDSYVRLDDMDEI